VSTERLLLVDDDPVFRDRLARALTARGMVVETAADADSALRLAEGGAFAAAIIDLRLGQDSGLRLVADLRSRHPALSMVVLTGFGSIATALEAVRLGARDYLTKPVEPEQILQALRGERVAGMMTTAADLEPASLDRVEWEHIQRVLCDVGHNITRAAKLLGIDRRSLQRKLAKYPPPR
jgi:two-component system response regulator RegA